MRRERVVVVSMESARTINVRVKKDTLERNVRRRLHVSILVTIKEFVFEERCVYANQAIKVSSVR